jgi:YbbR domain-containing protein
VTAVRRFYALVRRNLVWKITALLAATAFWAAINASEPNADRYLRVAVRPVGLAKRLVLTSEIGDKVEVQLRGPGSILRTIEEERHGIVIDLRGVTPGAISIKVSPEMLNLPRRVQVLSISPPEIDLRIARLSSRPVPVRVVLVPTRRNGYTISDVAVTPGTVEVSGPAGRVERLKAVETEPINTLTEQGDVARDVALASAGGWFTFTPKAVRVAFTVREIEGLRKFDDVPVAIRDAKMPATVVPGKVALTLRGPQRRLTELQLEAGIVEADAADLEAGVHRVVPEVLVPDGFELEGVSPATVEVRLQAPVPQAEDGEKEEDAS